ncbi:hypothetical protein [Variovorax paradoxus]|uniref:hypothetical protein n=1 Tax=Variovorax paradoxus TaxID=34073 RepID=UPI0024802737|nr:hypothetical protein [Variovorax paradoxus]WGT63753.1 hypothetical protein QHG62_27660 [Variovorax paradoxus]
MTTIATVGAVGPIAGDGRLSRDRRFRRVAWTRGSIAPYTSTWIVVQRFLVLNRPSPQSFEADFIRNDASGMAMSLDCAVRPERSLRLSRFCRVTGEDAGSLKGSQVGHYPTSLWPLFGRFVVWCPACLAEGFHSVLFSLCGLQQCPVHNLPLEYRCRCGMTIPHGKLGSPFHAPGCCRCGRVFLEPAAARAPKSDPARDAVLEELANWLVGSASRFWFDVRDSWASYPGIERYMAHARHWAQVLRTPEPPTCWTSADASERCCKRWACSSHEFGGEAVRVRHDPSETSDFEAASAIFKAVKRHLLRHVLQRHTRRWIDAFVRSSDEAWILRYLPTIPAAQDAWCFLLWWQSCVWSVGLRDWFLRRSYQMPSSWMADHYAAFAAERPLHLLEMVFRGGSRRWLLQWTAAGSLLMLWAAARKAAAAAVADAAVIWGHGVVGELVVPAWSAAITRTGTLALCMDTPHVRCCGARASTDKAARVRRAQEQAGERRDRLASQCASDCNLYDHGATTWTAGPGIDITAGGDARKRRLLGETRCFFVIARLPCADGARFAAQSLSHPVAAIANSSAGAIHGLRVALAQWKEEGGPSGGQEVTGKRVTR